MRKAAVPDGTAAFSVHVRSASYRPLKFMLSKYGRREMRWRCRELATRNANAEEAASRGYLDQTISVS